MLSCCLSVNKNDLEVVCGSCGYWQFEDVQYDNGKKKKMVMGLACGHLIMCVCTLISCDLRMEMRVL